MQSVPHIGLALVLTLNERRRSGPRSYGRRTVDDLSICRVDSRGRSSPEQFRGLMDADSAEQIASNEIVLFCIDLERGKGVGAFRLFGPSMDRSDSSDDG